MNVLRNCRWIALVVAALAMASACSSSGTAAGTAQSPGTTAGTGALARDLKTYFAGTDRALPASGPKGVPGKTVWVLPCSAAALGCSIPADAAVAAGKALGWKMTLVDGKFDPNTESNQVRAAVAAHADGLITVAVDCPTVAGALKAAKTAGVKVLSVYGFDCDNSYTKGQRLFSGQVGFGPYKTYQGFVAGPYTRSIVAYIEQATNGKAEIVEFTESDLLVTRTLSDAFDSAIKACGGCTVHKVPFTGFDVVSGSALQQKASAALSRYPNATVVMAPYDATILLGIGAAVSQARAAGRALILTGGEGLPPNIALIHKGTQQFAAGLPTDWAGWAAVDELNRAFAGRPSVDEGIGLRSIDQSHPGGCRPYVADKCVDFEADYQKIWGVG